MKTSLTVTTLAGAASAPNLATAAEKASAKEYYELRVYTLKPGPQLQLLDSYLRDAAIPALNRLGCSPVGVFTEPPTTEAALVYMLIPHKSVESYLNVPAKLAQDAAHQKAGEAYLNVEAPAAAYVRYETSLLSAIDGIPKLEAPPKGPRIFQLRIYESHSEAAGAKKIEMFNRGEIGIFRRTGLRPVFFGQTLLGTRMPNLTYLLTFPDKAALDKAWATFRADPEWLKLKAVPEYADAKIVSKVTAKILEPTACSQI